ncbi:hypothetical protein OH77DRAFT_1423821 [Trametes cingulata]|nr:hypothetical protein OH77DRAFT_1423821 [Trametes cingulata]
MKNKKGKGKYYGLSRAAPVAEVPPASTSSKADKVVPFWESQQGGKVSREEHSSQDGHGKPCDSPNTEAECGSASQSGTTKATPAEQDEPPAEKVQGRETHAPPPANVSWEEVGQFALNASISAGSFEDLHVIAYSKRLPSGRIGGPRMLYANSALVVRALGSFNALFEQGVENDNEEDATSLVDGLTDLEGVLPPIENYEYHNDSDLEDCETEDRYEEEAEIWSPSPPSRDTAPAKSESTGKTPRAPSPPPEDRNSPQSLDKQEIPPDDTPVSENPAPNEQESNGTPPKDEGLPSPSSNTGYASGSQVGQEHEAAESTRAGFGRKPTPKKKAREYRLLVVLDMAYRTWRAFVFYAYTRRIAFAPLRSQGLPFAPSDDVSDGSQLPICSPKSMYRLAVKYGNAELQNLAGNDICSKLSTQNVLPELFSPFTAKYPEIQDMELHFLLMYLKHPDITVRLPTWIDKFARGELQACADTFGRLIHKLACATVTPFSGFSCPKGCAMPTIQHRCGMCGFIFT